MRVVMIKPQNILLMFFIIDFMQIFCYEEQFFFCNHRIYSENILLSISEVNHLCDIIRKKDRFTILITARKDLKQNEDYTKEAEHFFSQNCNNNIIPCPYAFSISIFTHEKKLKITAGKEVNKMLKWNQWDSVLQEMISEMKKNEYYDAIEDGIYLLDQFVPYDTKHPPFEHDKDNHRSSFGFGKFLLFIVLPICGIIALWYYYKKTKENESNNCVCIDNDTGNLSHNNNHYQSGEYINEALITSSKAPIMLNTITTTTTSINDISTKIKIHNHITFILDLLKEIKNNMPSLITLDKCIICQQKILSQTSKQYIEMLHVANDQNNETPPLLSNYQTPHPSTYPSSNDNQNTRFGCLHLYHRNCLQQYHLMSCIMCFQSSQNAMEIIPNNYDTHVIEETHLKTLIQFFTMLYQPSDLIDYSISYANEYNYLSINILPAIESYWKIQQGKSHYINGYTPPNMPNFYEKPSQYY